MTKNEDSTAVERKAKSRAKYHARIAKMSPDELASVRDRAKARAKTWHRQNPETPGSDRRKIRNEKKRARRAANPDKTAEARKRWGGIRREEKLAARRAKHAARTPEKAAKIKDRKQRYRKANAAKIAEAKQAWDEANRDRIKAYAKANMQRFSDRTMERYRTEPKFALNMRMSSLVRNTLKSRGGKKSARWEELVGYTVAALEKRLHKTLPKGSTWQDFLDGKLHIEHRIPLAVFNFSAPEHGDFRRAWALTNLRLLSGPDNLRKGTRLDAPFQPALAL